MVGFWRSFFLWYVDFLVEYTYYIYRFDIPADFAENSENNGAAGEFVPALLRYDIRKYKHTT